MKKLTLVVVLSMATVLSGCVGGITMATAEKVQMSKSEQYLQFSDNVIAIAMPKTPIPNRPNALVLIGEKNNYILEGFIYTDKENVDAILKHLDLNYLRIQKIGKAEYNKEFKYYGAGIVLRYDKPKDKLTKQEQEVIKATQNDNRCLGGTYAHNSPEAEKHCSMYLDVKLVPLKKPENQTLKHTFSQPYQIDFYAKKTHLTSGVALAPLTMALDLVTLPIQIVGGAVGSLLSW